MARRAVPFARRSRLCIKKTVSPPPHSPQKIFQTPDLTSHRSHSFGCFSDGCRPQIPAPRSSAVGRYPPSRIFHHLLRQGSASEALCHSGNRSWLKGFDPASSAVPYLVDSCRLHHAGPCSSCSGISAGSGHGEMHSRLETMDIARPRDRLAKGFLRAPTASR